MKKGTPVKVIKDGVVIAVCENVGDAMRLTQISKTTIKRHMVDRKTTRGYGFRTIPTSEQYSPY